MKRLLILFGLLLVPALFSFTMPAAAQNLGAVTVANCGAPNNSPVVGNPYSLTQDTAGHLCTSGLSAPQTYALLTNASATGPTQTVSGGNYLLGPISGTFNGATVTVNSTVNGVTTAIASYTAPSSTTSCFAIATGTQVQAVVTGGPPSNVNLSLGGVGSGACSSGGGGQTNYALETGGNLATVATAQGAIGTGITPPTGGSGLLGYSSGAYSVLSGLSLSQGSTTASEKALLTMGAATTSPAPCTNLTSCPINLDLFSGVRFQPITPGGVDLDLSQPGLVNLVFLPPTATVEGATSGDVANASAAASLPAVTGKTEYLCGYSIAGQGATAAGAVNATITGLATGTQNLTATWAAASPVSVPQPQPVTGCIPASAANTAITLTLPALGTGSAHATVNVSGYAQ